MASRLGRARRWRHLTIAASALYCLVVVAAAFEHHDLLCHLKTSQHCTACTATPVSSDPQTLAAPRTADLADAGRATMRHLIAEGALLSVRTTGRSPPSLV